MGLTVPIINNRQKSGTFKQVDLLAKAQQGKKINIVDNMMKMLEEYSNNLEGIVRARTAELEVEKQKSQELLRLV